MNLEDFKSFRRVLKPSEVGSIPTHSRQFRRAAALRPAAARLLAVAVLLAAAPGNAQEPAPAEADAPPPAAGVGIAPGEPAVAAAERTGREIVPGPLNRAMRSVIFPAWGQLTNGRERKAAVLFGVQSYVWTRVVMEGRKGTESERRMVQLELDGAAASEIAAAEASADEHFERRRDLLFWAIMSTFYGALDAYIDAHLGDFDQEMEEGRELFGSVGPGGVEFGMRF